MSRGGSRDSCSLLSPRHCLWVGVPELGFVRCILVYVVSHMPSALRSAQCLIVLCVTLGCAVWAYLLSVVFASSVGGMCLVPFFWLFFCSSLLACLCLIVCCWVVYAIFAATRSLRQSVRRAGVSLLLSACGCVTPRFLSCCRFLGVVLLIGLVVVARLHRWSSTSPSFQCVLAWFA